MGLYQSVCPSQIIDRHGVIIGGGYGGIEVASMLKKWNVPFTIIDPKEYFHHVVGALRAAVDEGRYDDVLIIIPILRKKKVWKIAF